MRKILQSERGGTLILVLGAIIVVTIMIAPLVMAMNTGHLQAVKDSNYEQANAKVESMAVAFQRLLLEDQEMIDSKEELIRWGTDFKSEFSNFCAGSNMAINEDSFGNPKEVVMSCADGTGATARTSTLKFQLRFNPGGGLPFYLEHAVVTSYADKNHESTFNDVFQPFGVEDPQPEGFVNNDYDPEKYEQEFLEYMDTYTGKSFNDRFDQRPALREPLQVPQKVTNISTENKEKPITVENSKGVRHAGDVILSNHKIDRLEDSSGTSVEAAGSVTLDPKMKQQNIDIDGHVKAGGNIELDYFNKLTVKGDMLSNKDIIILDSNEKKEHLIIEGDLSAKGNITINNVEQITVKGSVIAGGTITVNGGLGKDFVVEGEMSAQNIYFNGTSEGMLSIGKWSNTAPGQSDVHKDIHNIEKWIQDSAFKQRAGGKWKNEALDEPLDSRSLIAGKEIYFQSIPVIRVSGDISAGSIRGDRLFNASIVRTGGSFITGSSIAVQQVYLWMIEKSLSVSGSVSANQPGFLFIGDSMYTKDQVSMTSAALKIGGSLLSKGSFIFHGSTLSFLQIIGDLILTNNSSLTFDSAAWSLSSVQVGGSLVSSGNISFPSVTANILIGKDIIAAGNMTYNYILDNFIVGGYLMAKNAVDLTDMQPIYNWNSQSQYYEFGGYYTGGNTTFPSSFEDGSGNNAIIIKHVPPTDDGGRRPVPKIGFGSWNSTP